MMMLSRHQHQHQHQQQQQQQQQQHSSSLRQFGSQFLLCGIIASASTFLLLWRNDVRVPPPLSRLLVVGTARRPPPPPMRATLNDNVTSGPQSQSQTNHSSSFLLLETTLCQDKCQTNCHVYHTPLHQCYNAHSPPYYPQDPSFSKFDILDVVVRTAMTESSLAPETLQGPLRVPPHYYHRTTTTTTTTTTTRNTTTSTITTSSFYRYIFASTNGTCMADAMTDALVLPCHVCVGPFGAPRPWGTFQILPT